MTATILDKSDRYVHIDEDNTILESTEEYLDNSVTLFLCDNNWNKVSSLTCSELGSKYIRITSTLTLNDKVLIEYKIKTFNFDIDTNILVRIKRLEDIILKQDLAITELTKAMSNRVDKHTFRVWLKAMEKNYGKPILEDNLLGIYSVPQADLD